MPKCCWNCMLRSEFQSLFLRTLKRKDWPSNGTKGTYGHGCSATATRTPGRAGSSCSRPPPRHRRAAAGATPPSPSPPARSPRSTGRSPPPSGRPRTHGHSHQVPGTIGSRNGNEERGTLLCKSLERRGYTALQRSYWTWGRVPKTFGTTSQERREGTRPSILLYTSAVER
jgi:hypothetical protein